MRVLLLVLIFGLVGCASNQKDFEAKSIDYSIVEKTLTCSEFGNSEYGDLIDYIDSLKALNIVTSEGSNEMFHFKVRDSMPIFGISPRYIGHGIFDVIGTYATFDVRLKRLVAAVKARGVSLIKYPLPRGKSYYLGEEKAYWRLEVTALHSNFKSIGKSMIQCVYIGP